MKTIKVLLKIARINGLIMIVIGCILTIPVFIGSAISLIFIAPGMKIWQTTSDKLDDMDAEDNDVWDSNPEMFETPYPAHPDNAK